MFGIRIAINAADNTTRAIRGVESRLKRFSRSVMSVLNFGGLAIAFQKVGSYIDRAFKVSTYAAEWERFKNNMSSGFADIVGRVADAWGPMIARADEFGKKILGYINEFVDKIQFAGAYWGAIFSGKGPAAAVKAADDVVAALKKERDARKAAQQNDASQPPTVAQESRQEDVRFDGRQAAKRSRFWNSLRMRTERRAGTARLNGGSSNEAYRLVAPERDDYLADAIDSMDTDDLERTAVGSMSGIKAAMRGAKKDAKQRRRLDRLTRRAEHNVARRARMGVSRETAIAALPARMRMAMEAKERKAMEDSWKKAIIATEEHSRKIAEEMTKGMTR